MPQSLTAGHSQQQSVENLFRAASRISTGLSPNSQYVSPEMHQWQLSIEEARRPMASAATTPEQEIQPPRGPAEYSEWVELESSGDDEEDGQVEDCKFFTALELMDGAANIQQMIEKLQAAARELRQFRDQGYELEGPVEMGKLTL